MYLSDKFKEECGVFGIYMKEVSNPAAYTYYGLYGLQHRGQESAGIAVLNDDKITCYKGMGLLYDALKNVDISSIRGKAAIGHVRYSTTGSSSINNAQPIYSEFKLGPIAIAHNGNLVNAGILRGLMEDGGCMFQTSVDTEIVLNLIARGAKNGVESAVADAMQAVKGSYAIVMLTKNMLVGVRDPNGIRPLCIGKLGENYILSSESCALDGIGAEFVRDVEPGEIVMIDDSGIRSVFFAEKAPCRTCAFEYIYFARPDSTIDKINVYESRVKAGKMLYEESPVDADIVIGVPDSGIGAAVGYSEASGIPYGMGFIKNKYVGRTFIAPEQNLREIGVSLKLNPLKVNVEGKRVVLIDDSIVRGTTCKKLVESIRKAGAKEVHFRIASPVVKFPCYFGIDTPYRDQLIGANLTVDEIRDEIGADSLSYLSIKGLLKVLECGKGFCIGCFNGEYPVSAPFQQDKLNLERREV